LGRFDSIEWWSFNVRVFVNALLKPSWVFVLVNSFVDRIVQRGVFFGVIFFCYPWVLFQLIDGHFFQIRYSLDFFEEFFLYDVWVFSSVSYSTDPYNFRLFFLIIKRCIWIAYCQWLFILLLRLWYWVQRQKLFQRRFAFIFLQSLLAQTSILGAFNVHSFELFAERLKIKAEILVVNFSDYAAKLCPLLLSESPYFHVVFIEKIFFGI
jgi:hypothetical protein